MKKKNLREVGGVSLVHRAVALATMSRCVTEIHVSTDDPQIAAHTRELGDYAQFRRAAECASDDARDEQVVAFVLDEFERRGKVFDHVVYLRPTAPCREEGVIDAAFRAFLLAKGARSLKAVSTARQHPYKMWWRDESGFLSPILPALHEGFDGEVDIPRQELPIAFASSAAIDIVRVADFYRDGKIHTSRILGFEIPNRIDIDVDTELDLQMAELTLRSTIARKR